MTMKLSWQQVEFFSPFFFNIAGRRIFMLRFLLSDEERGLFSSLRDDVLLMLKALKIA